MGIFSLLLRPPLCFAFFSLFLSFSLNYATHEARLRNAVFFQSLVSRLIIDRMERARIRVAGFSVGFVRII